MKLHETIRNFYVKVVRPWLKLEVLTEDGVWNKVTSVNMTQKQQLYRIKTDFRELLCTKNHILIDANGEELFAVESFGKEVKTELGTEKVVCVEPTDKFDHAYDVSLAEGTDHLYYANGFLSHNCLIIDEMAFIPKNIIDEFFASVIPVVSSSKNSKIVAVSTPNGASGMYYDLWQKANSKDARANEEGWKPFRINWWETGGIRDEKWKAQQIASIGIEKWKQEFECDFLTSATSRMVPDDILEKYRMALSELKASNKEFYLGKTHKIMSENQDKVYEFTMWHEFQEDKTYAASGDVAEGGGGDESVLYIWDISDLKEIKLCAKFSSNQVSPTEFAFITKKILELYGNPYYICERNGLGSGYLDSLRITYGYDNIVREAKNNEIGVISHAMTKSKACLWAKDMMTTAGFSFKLYDKDLIDELGTFCKKDNKGVHLTYCALPNCHDDHVMAFIWLCWLLQSDVIERYYSVYKTFTSALGNVYAELVAPIKPYERSEVKRITNDPIYQDFLDFKAELQNKLGKIIEQEKQAPSDIYFSNQDPYFGGFDSSPSWNTPQTPAYQSAAGLNPANHRPQFFVF